MRRNKIVSLIYVRLQRYTVFTGVDCVGLIALNATIAGGAIRTPCREKMQELRPRSGRLDIATVNFYFLRKGSNNLSQYSEFQLRNGLMNETAPKAIVLSSIDVSYKQSSWLYGKVFIFDVSYF